MMLATWVGGPWDGRTDVLPDGTESVAVAHAREYVWDFDGTEHGVCYIENRCPVMADTVQLRYVIVWREP